MIKLFGKLSFIEKATVHIISFISAIIWVIPILYLISYSLENEGFGNYKAVLTLDLFPRIVMNSIIVSFFVVTILLICIALGAYSFSKIKFSGSEILFGICLIGLMIPPTAMLVPIFQTIKYLHMINTYFSLIGPQIALGIPFALLITRGFFDELPDGLLEAAIIDGANVWKRFQLIVLPLGIPILTTAGILAFLNSWNEYLLPLSFINIEKMMTVTVSTRYFIDEYTADYRKVFAALVLISIPIIFIYIFGQKNLQHGLTSGAIK